jgi:hypothetical protein
MHCAWDTYSRLANAHVYGAKAIAERTRPGGSSESDGSSAVLYSKMRIRGTALQGRRTSGVCPDLREVIDVLFAVTEFAQLPVVQHFRQPPHKYRPSGSAVGRLGAHGERFGGLQQLWTSQPVDSALFLVQIALNFSVCFGPGLTDALYHAGCS